MPFTSTTANPNELAEDYALPQHNYRLAPPYPLLSYCNQPQIPIYVAACQRWHPDLYIGNATGLPTSAGVDIGKPMCNLQHV